MSVKGRPTSSPLTDEEIRAFRTRYPNWPADTLAGFVGGLLASLILVLLLAWQADWVAARTLEANPSCDSPRGLHRVTVREATGASESDQHDPTEVEAERGDLPVYAAARAVDDASQTLWIPPLVPATAKDGTEQRDKSRTPHFRAEEGQNVLTLHLAAAADVRLVCVVNGATLWYTSYQNWGRVRTVKVWGRSEDDAQVTILRSLGSDDFPNAQQAARGLGNTDVVNVALLDAYSGQRVENFNAIACLDDAGPRTDGEETQLDRYTAAQEYKLDQDEGIKYRYEPGCILEPKVKAGLAEVYLYAKD